MGSLDALNFFVANLQTGFGPFIAVYLTEHRWTQGQIGLALSLGTLASILGQLPGGAFVDWLRRKRLAAYIGLATIAVSASLLAIWPARLPVTIAQVLHSVATCMLVPAIAAVTLNRVPPERVAERLGRNARFAALGNAIGAALMGAFGTWVSSRAVFWLAALLCGPALAAVAALPPGAAIAASRQPAPARPPKPGLQVLLDRRLVAFGFCAVMFHLANAAMLPIAAGEVTAKAGGSANIIVAACLVGPQFLVAALSPAVGRAAERWGRRPVLMLGFAALPARALLFAAFAQPVPIVLAQLLDGVGGAVFGVMVPLVCADITRGTNRFNLSVGAVGLAVSVGATLSTYLAGTIASAGGNRAAFLALAAAGGLAVLTVFLLMPETRPTRPARPSPGA